MSTCETVSIPPVIEPCIPLNCGVDSVDKNQICSKDLSSCEQISKVDEAVSIVDGNHDGISCITFLRSSMEYSTASASVSAVSSPAAKSKSIFVEKVESKTISTSLCRGVSGDPFIDNAHSQLTENNPQTTSNVPSDAALYEDKLKALINDHFDLSLSSPILFPVYSDPLNSTKENKSITSLIYRNPSMKSLVQKNKSFCDNSIAVPSKHSSHSDSGVNVLTKAELLTKGDDTFNDFSPPEHLIESAFATATTNLQEVETRLNKIRFPDLPLWESPVERLSRNYPHNLVPMDCQEWIGGSRMISVLNLPSEISQNRLTRFLVDLYYNYCPSHIGNHVTKDDDFEKTRESIGLLDAIRVRIDAESNRTLLNSLLLNVEGEESKFSLTSMSASAASFEVSHSLPTKSRKIINGLLTESMALAVFNSEWQAWKFWCVVAGEQCHVYGHRIYCMADPAGLKIFAETAALYRMMSDAVNDKTELRMNGIPKINSDPTRITFIPHVNRKLFAAIQSYITSLNQEELDNCAKMTAWWDHQNSGMYIQFSSGDELSRYCCSRFSVRIPSSIADCIGSPHIEAFEKRSRLMSLQPVTGEMEMSSITDSVDDCRKTTSRPKWFFTRSLENDQRLDSTNKSEFSRNSDGKLSGTKIICVGLLRLSQFLLPCIFIESSSVDVDVSSFGTNVLQTAETCIVNHRNEAETIRNIDTKDGLNDFHLLAQQGRNSFRLTSDVMNEAPTNSTTMPLLRSATDVATIDDAPTTIATTPCRPKRGRRKQDNAQSTTIPTNDTVSFSIPSVAVLNKDTNLDPEGSNLPLNHCASPPENETTKRVLRPRSTRAAAVKRRAKRHGTDTSRNEQSTNTVENGQTDPSNGCTSQVNYKATKYRRNV